MKLFDVEERQYVDGHLDVVVTHAETGEEIATLEVRPGGSARNVALWAYTREADSETPAEPSEPYTKCFRSTMLSATLP